MKLQIDNDFIKSYENLIYKLILDTGVKHRDTVDEIYSRVIQRVLISQYNYDSEKGAVSTWLTYQVRSVVSNYFRDRDAKKDITVRNERLMLKDDHQIDTVIKAITNSNLNDRAEIRQTAYDLIWSSPLSYRLKEAMSDKYLDAMTHKEIAEKRGIKESTVDKRIKRAMRKLRNIYGKQKGTETN